VALMVYSNLDGKFTDVSITNNQKFRHLTFKIKK